MSAGELDTPHIGEKLTFVGLEKFSLHVIVSGYVSFCEASEGLKK